MLKIGDVIQGVITGVKSYGLFVENQKASFKGLIHISECSDDYVDDLNSLYKVGQTISCMIVDIDPANSHVSLSIRTLYQGTQIHDQPMPMFVHARHKFYWTNDEDLIGFQSVAEKLPGWKRQAREDYQINS